MISKGKWTVPGYVEKFGNLSKRLFLRKFIVSFSPHFSLSVLFFVDQDTDKSNCLNDRCYLKKEVIEEERILQKDQKNGGRRMLKRFGLLYRIQPDHRVIRPCSLPLSNIMCAVSFAKLDPRENDCARTCR